MSQTQHLNAVRRDLSHRNLRPRDAASLVIIDRSGATPRVLFGRRHPKQEFVPDMFVFPGGRMDRSDSRLQIADDLPVSECRRLMFDMKGRASPGRARGLALAAIRETFEETGLLLGKPTSMASTSRATSWCNFLGYNVEPLPSQLIFVARAITPPGRNRRYDTRFFAVDHSAICADSGRQDGEFTSLQWATYDEARDLNLHIMTRTILDDVYTRLNTKQGLTRNSSVPYYVHRHGQFVRLLVPRTPG